MSTKLRRNVALDQSGGGHHILHDASGPILLEAPGAKKKHPGRKIMLPSGASTADIVRAVITSEYVQGTRLGVEASVPKSCGVAVPELVQLLLANDVELFVINARAVGNARSSRGDKSHLIDAHDLFKLMDAPNSRFRPWKPDRPRISDAMAAIAPEFVGSTGFAAKNKYRDPDSLSRLRRLPDVEGAPPVVREVFAVGKKKPRWEPGAILPLLLLFDHPYRLAGPKSPRDNFLDMVGFHDNGRGNFARQRLNKLARTMTGKGKDDTVTRDALSPQQKKVTKALRWLHYALTCAPVPTA